jgi:hypothetical protein
MTTIAPNHMVILSAVRSISHDVAGRYQIIVNQTKLQRQTKTHHSQWLESEYHGDIYSPNTSDGSVGEEKLHHSR